MPSPAPPTPPPPPEGLPPASPAPMPGDAGHGPREHVVFWHGDAPAQPAMGQPCNGCGLCCLAEPCPLGMLVSRRRHGACVALRWLPGSAAEGADGASGAPAGAPAEVAGDAPGQEGGRYVCGMVADPAGVTGWRNRWLLRALARLARRWIAAGQGCDAPPLHVAAVRPDEDGRGRRA